MFAVQYASVTSYGLGSWELLELEEAEEEEEAELPPVVLVEEELFDGSDLVLLDVAGVESLDGTEGMEGSLDGT